MSPQPPRPLAFRLQPVIVGLSAVMLTAGITTAQGAKADMRELKRERALEAASAGGVKRDKDLDPRGAKPKPDDATARGLARLREQLEVTDDVEWDIIGERINRVIEARSSLGKGGSPGRGGPTLAEKSKKSSRAGASSHPEQEALRLAVRDKLPDAEIKSRLDRAHEVMQQREAQLARAQSDLRAVLTVRQEAVAVLVGLLPP